MKSTPLPLAAVLVFQGLALAGTPPSLFFVSPDVPGEGVPPAPPGTDALHEDAASFHRAADPRRRHADTLHRDGQAEGGLFTSTSHTPLELRLEADWDALDGDRDQESPHRPGRIVWTDSDGREIAIPVQVRTRGTFRLKRSTCSFPPLRLEFPASEAEGTPFHGQDRIKLVTHCRDRDSYEQNVLEEYLAYRIYNLLTDISFRVRLANITYLDAAGGDAPQTRLAFFVEDEDSMAARLGGMMLEVPAASASSFHQEQAGLMYLFQFMIGNTDWSMTHFHNVRLMRIESEYFPVPYDFDWSGLVDAPYSGPSPVIAHLIDNVRERLYQGACNDAIDYDALFARFRDSREAILALPRSIQMLSDRNQRSAVRYLTGFFEVLENEGAARRQIVDACRG